MNSSQRELLSNFEKIYFDNEHYRKLYFKLKFLIEPEVLDDLRQNRH